MHSGFMRPICIFIDNFADLNDSDSYINTPMDYAYWQHAYKSMISDSRMQNRLIIIILDFQWSKNQKVKEL